MEPSEHQPRESFDGEKLEALAESIRTHGVLQPIAVRRLDGDHYQIIAGERRWRSLWFYLYTLRRAHRQGIPVVMYGCGIGPVLHRADRRLAGKVISRNADVITLRENDSLAELEALGVKGPEILLTADPSLTLRTHDRTMTEGVLRAAGLDPAGERYVAFLLRPWPGFEEKAPASRKSRSRKMRLMWP